MEEWRPGTGRAVLGQLHLPGVDNGRLAPATVHHAYSLPARHCPAGDPAATIALVVGAYRHHSPQTRLFAGLYGNVQLGATPEGRAGMKQIRAAIEVAGLSLAFGFVLAVSLVLYVLKRK